MRLLQVEDDVGQRRAVTMLLSREGFDVVECGTLSEAADLLQAEMFPICILDLQLEDEHGIELLKQLDEQRIQQTSFIIYSAYGTFDAARDALNLGAFAFMEKLGDPSELINQVHRAAAERMRKSLSRAEVEISLQMGLLDSVRQATIATDLSGRVIYWNRFAETLYGWSPEEAVGRNSIDLMVPIEGKPAAEEIMQQLRAGHVWNGEFVMQRRDGTSFPAEVTTSPILDHDNQLVGIIGVSNDITDRKAAQDELLRLQDETAHLARLNTMAEMAAGLSHELNQPLSAIANLAAVCVARLESTTTADQGKLLDLTTKIRDMAHQSADIIRGLRSFTQRQRREPETTDLGKIIQFAIEMLSFELRRSHTVLELDLCKPDVPVTVDVVQIQQVIINLVRNAVQAINDNISSDRRVTVSMRRNVDSVEVRISDTGPGIARDQMERLFEAFVTSKINGTGIGLALSSRIIQAHRGKLDAWNNDVAGATLRLQLPIQEAME
jgi:PAS domain S-box-containing protein